MTFRVRPGELISSGFPGGVVEVRNASDTAVDVDIGIADQTSVPLSPIARREAVADMVRAERDVEALREFGKKSRSASEYIRALEAFYDVFDNTCTDASLAPLPSRAVDAWMRVCLLREARNAKTARVPDPRRSPK